MEISLSAIAAALTYSEKIVFVLSLIIIVYNFITDIFSLVDDSGSSESTVIIISHFCNIFWKNSWYN